MRHHVHVDLARVANDLICGAWPQDGAQSAAARSTDNHLRPVDRPRELQDRARDVLPDHRVKGPAEVLGELSQSSDVIGPGADCPVASHDMDSHQRPPGTTAGDQGSPA